MCVLGIVCHHCDGVIAGEIEVKFLLTQKFSSNTLKLTQLWRWERKSFDMGQWEVKEQQIWEIFIEMERCLPKYV